MTFPQVSPTMLAFGLAAAALVGAVLLVRARRRTKRLEADLDQARQLGNWTLEKKLGQGGMGEVWLARHRLLPRPAAVKFIRPEALGADDTGSAAAAVKRFEREAHATAQLTSPHTISVLDFGVAPDGSLAYVMEFLEGQDLETLVRTHGPLPPARVVYLLRQVCISLAEAHAARLVHRDLKPANIYACRLGVHWDFAKVLDFGMVAESGSPDEDPGGTPAYLAPEMARGRPVDARSDIYALGGVMTKLLTGTTPFPASTVSEMIQAHLFERPAPLSQRTDRKIPRDLELVVLKCLAKDPDDRWSSVLELSRALARCDVGEPWTPGKAMTWWTTVGGAAVGAAAGGAAESAGKGAAPSVLSGSEPEVPRDPHRSPASAPGRRHPAVR